MADYDDSGDELQRLLSANPVGVDLSNVNLSDFNLGDIASGFSGDIGNLGITPDFLSQISTDPELFRAFQAEFPEDAAIVGALIGGSNELVGPNPVDAYERGSGEFLGENIKSGVPEWDKAATDAGLKLTDPNTKTGKLNLSDLLKYGLPALGAYASYKSAKDAQKQAAGAKFESRAPVKATKVGGRGVKYSAQGGGIGSLDMAQGGRALPPRYLDGHSDGMADKVPAHIDGKRPAALSDGEFVIPADVVSHLGNGNSNAGAKRLYEMMDRIRSARTGNHKQGKQINPDKFIPR